MPGVILTLPAVKPQFYVEHQFSSVSVRSRMHPLSLLTIGLHALNVVAFNNSRRDNVLGINSIFSYWGQSSNTTNAQHRLAFYCADNVIDVFPIAFLQKFFGTGGAPEINLANTCNPAENGTFPGTSLINCASLAPDITSCQAKGKIVTLSLGGAEGTFGFQSSSQATAFAHTVWNMFLGGSSATRPFGHAILDGIDLDFENGTSDHFAPFVNTIRSLAKGADKQYYITAAPQCTSLDSAWSGLLNSTSFDAIYVQFYNNPCGLQHFGSASYWNFGLWDHWARKTSLNKNVKVLIGAPASSGATQGGYVSANTLRNITIQMRKSFPSFGGVMLWDASQAYANNRYDKAIKSALSAAERASYKLPTCFAPAYAVGTAYPASSEVSFEGYIWQAKWSSSSKPTSDPNGDWSAISACSGAAASSHPFNSTSICDEIAAWSSSVAYLGGMQVVDHLWTTKWGAHANVPGGSANVWINNGACTSNHVSSTSSFPAASTSSLLAPNY
ncbi:carbohydrate-binding module family 5 protein [Laccaria amethystina LaAM-08-1]|uniref:chitinase n=1 Tax=Laccaria amethystina LaAM-08-1 TaxID=1095629 RepID=A0A0C9XVG2_9AGAR|nr:carbohydrate-binding module family 5 protein [Laccaria amethystina LaAM-08-1]